MASPGRVLHLSENLTLPFDRRVWMELNALREAGYEVSAICPMGEGGTAPHEVLQGIAIWRYPAPPPTRGFLSYVWEFLYCWLQTLRLTLTVLALNQVGDFFQRDESTLFQRDGKVFQGVDVAAHDRHRPDRDVLAELDERRGGGRSEATQSDYCEGPASHEGLLDCRISGLHVSGLEIVAARNPATCNPAT